MSSRSLSCSNLVKDKKFPHSTDAAIEPAGGVFSLSVINLDPLQMYVPFSFVDVLGTVATHSYLMFRLLLV